MSAPIMDVRLLYRRIACTAKKCTGETHVQQLKYFLYFLSLSFLSYHQVLAQDDLELTHLRTPSSPGFVLLETAPVSIERPTTPRGLATSLISGVTEEGLKPNYALEVSPYWLKSHPTLSFDAYYHPKNVLQNVLQTFSVSLATAPTQNVLTNGTDLAFGLRTQLFSGTAQQEFEDELQRLNTNLAINSDIFAVLTNSIIIDIEDGPGTSTLTKDTIHQFIETRFEEVLGFQNVQEMLSTFTPEEATNFMDSLQQVFINDANDNLPDTVSRAAAAIWINALKGRFTDSEAATLARLDFEDLDNEKVGFVMEVAFAQILSFPTNRIGYSRFGKTGVWVTMGYKVPKQHLDILGVGRYIANTSFGDSLNSLDYGASLVWHNDKMSIALEALQRSFFGTEEDNLMNKTTARYNLNFQYKLNEIISFTSSFGKNFDQPTGTFQNLISVFGVTYNINNAQRLSPQLDQ